MRLIVVPPTPASASSSSPPPSSPPPAASASSASASSSSSSSPSPFAAAVALIALLAASSSSAPSAEAFSPYLRPRPRPYLSPASRAASPRRSSRWPSPPPSSSSLASPPLRPPPWAPLLVTTLKQSGEVRADDDGEGEVDGDGKTEGVIGAGPNGDAAEGGEEVEVKAGAGADADADADAADSELDIDALVGEAAAGVVDGSAAAGVGESEGEEGAEDDDDDDEEAKRDSEMMRLAIELARSRGGERGARSSFPKPMVGAVIVSEDGRILGRGRSSYRKDAVRAAIADAGIVATPLREWHVSWPTSSGLRRDIRGSTLYVTLEPSMERQGTSVPPITQLIATSGISRVVIGCPDPIPEMSAVGADALHAGGLSVTMGVERDECESVISEYATLANSKLHRMARRHFERFGRPLGFLHCSVVDSTDILAFARHGNAFGKNFGGKTLSYRDFGSYELAPPPELVWARDDDAEDDEDDYDDGFTEVDDFFDMDFDEEDWQESLNSNPMMPWYEQVDACVATFPKPGNGPADDDSVSARLNGLKWLATHGNALPAAVERVLVMDATDLPDLPLTNDDPNLPRGVDVEAFWGGEGRRPTRVLLRHGDNAAAIAAAEGASRAAEAAAEAARAARVAIESGDAEAAADAAIEWREAAVEASEFLQRELQSVQDLKQRLIDKGTIVEVIKGGEPIDVMNHLGKRNGYRAVVWRAGCWGERGVQAILAGAFQWVSAHLAVDAVGGRFWQLILAEQAVQAACGPKSRVKVFADQRDINLEYCDAEDADKDCNLTIDGKPVRHVRLDCRVALIDPDRPRRLEGVKTVPLADKVTEEAPWFL